PIDSGGIAASHQRPRKRSAHNHGEVAATRCAEYLIGRLASGTASGKQHEPAGMKQRFARVEH
ncbi:MAG: hypothetical protein ACTILK_04475, partial [Bifidobacterium crudilactis]|uniref:hypothetical protein n=1 Tax=Bifidobacterium crudilactis TaxID=327277 RepID=UPI003F965537